jgi:enoyl-CoA hydratase/carnithine racemase
MNLDVPDSCSDVTHRSVLITIEDHVATVLLDRPPVNALNLDLYKVLGATFRELEANDAVHAVILGAKGSVFCAGADMKEHDPGPSGARAAAARDVFETIRHHPTPVIAAVNGPALGAGAVLAACCDVRYASETATIGLPEVNVALLGGGRHLMRLLPQGHLREIYFTGGALDAATALRLGLVQRVTAGSEVLKAARSLAGLIAEKSPQALRLAKEALNGIEGVGVEEGYRLEQALTRMLRDTPEATDMRAAFAARRPPEWSEP